MNEFLLEYLATIIFAGVALLIGVLFIVAMTWICVIGIELYAASRACDMRGAEPAPVTPATDT